MMNTNKPKLEYITKCSPWSSNSMTMIARPKFHHNPDMEAWEKRQQNRLPELVKECATKIREITAETGVSNLTAMGEKPETRCQYPVPVYLDSENTPRNILYCKLPKWHEGGHRF